MMIIFIPFESYKFDYDNKMVVTLNMAINSKYFLR